MLIHANFWVVSRIFSSKMGHTDKIFGMPSGIVSRLRTQFIYKSLCVVATICATMVDPNLDIFFHFDPCYFEK